MMWAEVDRPGAVRKHRAGSVSDQSFMEALRGTLISGRAVFVPTGPDPQGQMRGPVFKPFLHPLGYAFRQRPLPGGYAVWIEHDFVACPTCETVFDVVRHVNSGGARLRRRDECPSCHLGKLKGSR